MSFRFTIEIESLSDDRAAVIRALRWILKRLLRSWGFRCRRCEPTVDTEGDQ